MLKNLYWKIIKKLSFNFDPNINWILLYFSVSLVVVEYFLPLLIISFAYIRISCNLWGHKTPGESQDQRDQQLLKNKKKVLIKTMLINRRFSKFFINLYVKAFFDFYFLSKVIKMLVIVVTIFAVCWMPWQTWQTSSLIQPSVNR